MEHWEVIFEPGAVTVIEMISPATEGRHAADVQVERYVLDDSRLKTCMSVVDVEALLCELGVSPTKASDSARAIWDEAERLLGQHL